MSLSLVTVMGTVFPEPEEGQITPRIPLHQYELPSELNRSRNTTETLSQNHQLRKTTFYNSPMHPLPYHLIHCSAVALQVILVTYLADSTHTGAQRRPTGRSNEARFVAYDISESVRCFSGSIKTLPCRSCCLIVL